MILVDTGPLVALANPRDDLNQRCRQVLATLHEPLVTTLPVLTEVFHLLGPSTFRAAHFREYLLAGGLSIWFMDDEALTRAL